ncbi:effector-associated domain 2-containing protein [Yinghuangia aomiensis]
MDRFRAGRSPRRHRTTGRRFGQGRHPRRRRRAAGVLSYAQEILGKHVRVRDSGNPHLHLFHIVQAFGDVPDGWRALTHAVWIVSGKDHHAEYAASLVDPIEAAH